MLAAGHGDAAVGTFVADVGGRGAVLLVVAVGTVGVLSHVGGSFADRRRGRVGEGMEEVVGLEEDAGFLLILLVLHIEGGWWCWC